MPVTVRETKKSHPLRILQAQTHALFSLVQPPASPEPAEMFSDAFLLETDKL